MALPLIKVFSLVIKTVSKPIAKRIKVQTQKSPKFQSVLVWAARVWYNAGDRKTVRKELNVAAATDLGSELVSEGFLLIVAVALLVMETVRSAAKDAKKAEALEQRLQAIEQSVANQKQSFDEFQDKVFQALRMDKEQKSAEMDVKEQIVPQSDRRVETPVELITPIEQQPELVVASPVMKPI